MKYRFSRNALRMEPSAVRNKLFDDPSLITFAAGKPEQSLFPSSKLSELAAEILKNDGKLALQYGSTEGQLQLREQISKQLMKPAGCCPDPDSITLTSGSQEGIEIAGRLFLNEGDTVVCENPSYLGAFNAFRPYGPRIISVEMDENGLCVDELEKLLMKDDSIRLIYTIPDFQNPTGITMTDERRKKLAELAAKFQVPVIEDCPYSDLVYEGHRHPSIKSFDKEGWVIHLGSFSKIFCPGLRVGWVCAHPDIIERYVMAKQATNLQCGSLDERLALAYLQSTDINEHIGHLRGVYCSRRNAMLNALENYFPENVSYTHPQGGFFVWVKIDESIDTKELLAVAAEKAKVVYVPGEPFFVQNAKKNYLRLNYSFIDEKAIDTGLQRFGKLLANTQ